VACCSTLYGHPLAELLIGESFHPGGLASSRRLLEAARFARGARLLDVGCGLGASARMAADDMGARVDALDASVAVLDRARERVEGVGSQVTWHQADMAQLPFAAGAFDVVLAECVLSTTRRDEALAELARVLRPGGQLLLSDVTTTGGAIDGLADHAVLGAALCVSDAWQPGELERRLPVHGLQLQKRWDRSSDILRLVERIEGRLTIAASIAPGFEGPLDVARARGIAASVRTSVEAGDLGYFAAIATRA
jgi:arsenite methyltransferase